MKKISIVVPVYNIEKEIAKCLESLHRLKMKDAEFLIINDGSIDNTENIITQYLNEIKDTRFKYYYKKNQGVSVARNFGLNHANGKYIWFIDGDDQIISKVNNLETLDYIYDIANNNNLDVLEFGFEHKLKNGKMNQVKIPDSKVMSGKEFLINAFASNERGINIQIWHFLVKSSLLKENDVKFRKGIIYGEDLLWVAYVLNHAKRVMSVSKKCYIYFTRKGSVSLDETLFMKKARDLIIVLTELMQLLDDVRMSDCDKKMVGIYLTKRYIYTLIEVTSRKKKIVNKKNVFKFLNKDYLDIKDKIKLIIIFYLPMDISAFLCRKIQKINK